MRWSDHGGGEQPDHNAPAGGSQPIVIALFGAFLMTIAGPPVTSFRSNKARALPAYLLLASRQAVLRSDLMVLLWTDYTAESAQANLRQDLSNLRASVEPFLLLQTDRQTVQLQAPATMVWCDALAFMALLDAWAQHQHSAPSLGACPRSTW